MKNIDKINDNDMQIAKEVVFKILTEWRNTDMLKAGTFQSFLIERLKGE